MKYIPLWKRLLIAAVLIVTVAFCVPNFIPAAQREQWQKTLPAWVPMQSISLGLDLQGGSHLLLQADMDSVIKKRLDDAQIFARKALREANIAYSGLSLKDGAVILTLKDDTQIGEARKALKSADESLSIDQNGLELSAHFDDKALKDMRDKTIAQSIEIIERRVNGTGTKEPIIQRQGDDRILVQLPGMNDPERVKNLLKQTAQLTFHLVAAGGVTG